MTPCRSRGTGEPRAYQQAGVERVLPEPSQVKEGLPSQRMFAHPPVSCSPLPLGEPSLKPAGAPGFAGHSLWGTPMVLRGATSNRTAPEVWI